MTREKYIRIIIFFEQVIINRTCISHESMIFQIYIIKWKGFQTVIFVLILKVKFFFFFFHIYSLNSSLLLIHISYLLRLLFTLNTEIYHEYIISYGTYFVIKLMLLLLFYKNVKFVNFFNNNIIWHNILKLIQFYYRIIIIKLNT